ncbi:MAG TPA: cytochrome c oxidase subunit 3, partial [Patescibacteria group bacterium]|nr:cytochrome c oxidase subunit 3 [Patescibacteria group bacterium]
RFFVLQVMTILLGLAFEALQVYEFSSAFGRGMNLTVNNFASAFFAMTGFHGLHVLGGLILLSLILYRATRGQFSSKHHVGVAAVTLYWHFVDVVWLFLFGILYLGITAFR